MLKEILTANLRPTHRAAGLFLDEDEDELLVYLKREGRDKPLAVWVASTVTVEMIRDAADFILEREE